MPQTSKWRRLTLSASSRSPDVGWAEAGTACQNVGEKRAAIALNCELIRRVQDEAPGRIELAEKRLMRMMKALLSVDEGDTYIIGTTGNAQAASRLWSTHGAFRKTQSLADSTVCTDTVGAQGQGFVYASLAKVSGENAESAIARLFDNVRNRAIWFRRGLEVPAKFLKDCGAAISPESGWISLSCLTFIAADAGGIVITATRNQRLAISILADSEQELTVASLLRAGGSRQA